MQEESKRSEFEAKAKETFSAERKEDFAVLIIAAVVVLLVLLGVIDKKIVSAIYILKY